MRKGTKSLLIAIAAMSSIKPNRASAGIPMLYLKSEKGPTEFHHVNDKVNVYSRIDTDLSGINPNANSVFLTEPISPFTPNKKMSDLHKSIETGRKKIQGIDGMRIPILLLDNPGDVFKQTEHITDFNRIPDIVYKDDRMRPTHFHPDELMFEFIPPLTIDPEVIFTPDTLLHDSLSIKHINGPISLNEFDQVESCTNDINPNSFFAHGNQFKNTVNFINKSKVLTLLDKNKITKAKAKRERKAKIKKEREII